MGRKIEGEEKELAMEWAALIVQMTNGLYLRKEERKIFVTGKRQKREALDSYETFVVSVSCLH